MTHSPGEALFARLVSRAGFKFGDGFWRLIPEPYGRQRIRAGYQAFKDSPSKAWPKDADYQAYRKTFFRGYQRMCAEAGPRDCSRWLTALLAGFTDEELKAAARDTLAEELERPVGEESVRDSPEDPEPVLMRVGLRAIPEMRDLCRGLRARGFDVWVLSPSDQWSAQAAAALYGIDPSRVLGVRPKTLEGKLTAETLDPVPAGSGKTEALAMFLDRPPELAVGAQDDLAMLDYGNGTRLLLAPKEALSVAGPPPAWLERARRRGWLVQTAFSPVRGSQ